MSFCFVLVTDFSACLVPLLIAMFPLCHQSDPTGLSMIDSGMSSYFSTISVRDQRRIRLAKFQGIFMISQLHVSHQRNISDPPPDSSWSYCATSSAPMTDGLSVWLARRSGIPAGQLAGSGYWREQFQTISEDVSVCNVLVHSAQLEVSRRCAV